jgi:DNA-directed RNA polymerase specialized sigma subunit
MVKKRKTNYLNNKDLYLEVILSKETGIMTDKLARMLQMLTAKYAKRWNFANYTYNDDMQAYAVYMLVKTWQCFDPSKSDNPFGYYTQAIKRSFFQFLNKEKDQRNIRDALLIYKGNNASYTYNEEHSSYAHDEEDYDTLHNEYINLIDPTEEYLIELLEHEKIEQSPIPLPDENIHYE